MLRTPSLLLHGAASCCLVVNVHWSNWMRARKQYTCPLERVFGAGRGAINLSLMFLARALHYVHRAHLYLGHSQVDSLLETLSTIAFWSTRNCSRCNITKQHWLYRTQRFCPVTREYHAIIDGFPSKPRKEHPPAPYSRLFRNRKEFNFSVLLFSVCALYRTIHSSHCTSVFIPLSGPLCFYSGMRKV